MELEDNVITVELTKSGKPRKRKPKTSHTYFTEDTQNAIVEYVASQDQKFRDKVYRERIEYGFFKLTQNIIHTFKFYYTDGESVEDVQQEVIAFLLEKLKLYKPAKGYTKYVDKNLHKLFPKEIDAKTADAIIELFRKCESLDIFNKKALYIYIREMIDVDTPQITKIIKKLKVVYVELYNKYYEDNYINV